jgi:predicted heme/steroid binding protein
VTRKQKLELTWIGKDNRPKLEPRILLEESEKSCHAPHRVTDHDLFDNRLIFGDNLLALKALEQEFTGKIKCIYIKLEGFTYAPSDSVYWQHGHSTERDFIYVTTQNLSHEQLQQLSDEVGENRSLLVMCSAFRAKADRYPNLTIKKIPTAVLSRCEWGHDDYSLKVENLPKAPPKLGQMELGL